MNAYPFLEPPTKPGDLGQLGHYRVIDELGKGGMGYVFRAEDVKLKRAVALKVMNRKIAATPHSRRRFIHEARAMAAVHHDNVATIFEVGESKGTPFMAMEMLRGSTLEDMNQSKRRLGYDEIVELARQMSKGLAAAHAKGIVHRDIKPANIWIEQDSNRVKILDFGLALAASAVDHLAGRGAVVGTPGYLSPEQARSEPLDDRSDLYSLGVVLYELCTGQLPSDARSVPLQLISILAHRPTPINELNPEIPAPLCDLIHRLLRKEPRSRPGSAKSLLEELDHVEAECHVKSEVAQVINKLQLGLQQVVNKQASSSIFDVEVVPEVDHDPFAASPAPSLSAVPVTMVPAAQPTAAKQVANPAPAWQAYWPLATVAAVVLIALPLLTFLFTGVGRSNRTSLIVDDSLTSVSPQPSSTPELGTPELGTTDSATAGSGAVSLPMHRSAADDGSNFASSPGNMAGSQNIAGSQSNLNVPPPTDSQSDTATPNLLNPQANRVNQNQPGAGPDNRGRANPNRPAGNDSRYASGRPGQTSAPSPPSALSPTPSPPSASLPAIEAGSVKADANRSESLTPQPTPPRPEMKWTSISTSDGRGADAMVQNGSNQKFGLKLSLGVRTRSGVESNHSYLRFDLASIEETRRWADAAELVLSVVGEERPVGATVRVFAFDVGLWPEESLDWKKSPSSRGLDSLTLLGEATVGPDADSKDTGFNVIRIASPQLAQAVAKSTRDTLTLVLAGSGPDDSLLRFVSREQAASAAPRLEIQVPTTPPEQPSGRRGGRR